MFWRWLKRYMPRSLFGRAVLILLVPVIALQLVFATGFVQRYFAGVTQQLTDALRADLVLLLDAVNAADSPEAAAEAAREMGGKLSLIATFGTGPERDARRFYDFTGRIVTRKLHEELPAVEAIDFARVYNRLYLRLDTRWGDLGVELSRWRAVASNPHQLVIYMILTGVVFTVVAFVFLRNQLRPITRLASAAEDFGRGRRAPYRPSGATEVRAAGRAFLDMRERIERQIEQRTRMLSGVSHDLRTPLTRLKLALSMLEPSPEVAEMARDVEDMERILETFLNYARTDALEPTVPTDPAVLAAEVLDRAVPGPPVELCAEPGPPVPLRPEALGRALGNLVANAQRYGSRVRVSVHRRPGWVTLTVEDDGPSIPAEAREEAKKPFARLDAARNQDHGSGVGLGLAIAADAARQHGGTLELGDSAELGGLRAEIAIPA